MLTDGEQRRQLVGDIATWLDREWVGGTKTITRETLHAEFVGGEVQPIDIDLAVIVIRHAASMIPTG